VTPASSRLAWRLEAHDELGSTSDLVRARAEAGEPEGLAVLARRQTSARGTRGRAWSTPAGNLALSMLLRPRLPLRDAARLSLLCGAALAEAVAEILPPGTRLALKWPNDLMLNGNKLSGILLESQGDGQGDGNRGIAWVIPGIGVNLAHAPILPDRVAACLAEHIPPPDPEAFAPRLLARLAHWYAVLHAEGFAPVLQAWLAHAQPAGSKMNLKLGSDVLQGIFAGLDADGSLLMTVDGTTRRFATGEVLLPGGG
jgi:BirA family biotin operon repressor/biotin-[acetyl-CoA-carboxylase] ligase